MLLASTCALVTVLVAPAAEPGVASGMSPGTGDATTGEPQEFRAARADIRGFDEAAVLAALALRLPRLPIERHGGAAPTEAPYLYLQLTRAADDRGTIRVITSDGRAYERSFAVEIGQEVRVVASTAANLIFAVEQGAVIPDQEDVAIPPPAAAPELVPPEPAPPEPPPPEPSPPLDMAEETGPKAQVQKDMSDRPRWELGVGLHAAAVLGLGPPAYGGALGGGGGGLGLEVRSPRGLAAALETRAIGQAEAGVGLGRLRVAIAAGYALRRGRFELPILVGLAIEPWWVTRAGERAPLAASGDDDTVARPPLLGGFLRLSPGWRARPSPRLGLRVGPRIELGGSFGIDDHDGPRVVGLADAVGVPRFRVGGLELSLGLELALQFGLGPR
ncbi:hypothetical protein [Nannocystis bainbridge]|uniref:Uncharacterized protein n=1 Tax=Nannocystis bainbridge TaxID=2995303 RepID=A0ABT5DZ72_9BACT|nr:hypothetical protein [Nannocystis bainbridge]MDC0718905.1 hypothetical protein [Nannocystis bainbridge]